MQKISILNQNNPGMPPLLVEYCVSFLCRLRGLTFRRRLSPEGGLLLVQSHDSRMDAAIHMFGVWMNLGVIWINTGMQVVDVCLARSWHPLYIPKQPARFVLESVPARLDDFRIGDKVIFEPADFK